MRNILYLFSKFLSFSVFIFLSHHLNAAVTSYDYSGSAHARAGNVNNQNLISSGRNATAASFDTGITNGITYSMQATVSSSIRVDNPFGEIYSAQLKTDMSLNNNISADPRFHQAVPADADSSLTFNFILNDSLKLNILTSQYGAFNFLGYSLLLDDQVILNSSNQNASISLIPGNYSFKINSGNSITNSYGTGSFNSGYESVLIFGIPENSTLNLMSMGLCILFLSLHISKSALFSPHN